MHINVLNHTLHYNEMVILSFVYTWPYLITTCSCNTNLCDTLLQRSSCEKIYYIRLSMVTHTSLLIGPLGSYAEATCLLILLMLDVLTGANLSPTNRPIHFTNSA